MKKEITNPDCKSKLQNYYYLQSNLSPPKCKADDKIKRFKNSFCLKTNEKFNNLLAKPETSTKANRKLKQNTFIQYSSPIGSHADNPSNLLKENTTKQPKSLKQSIIWSQRNNPNNPLKASTDDKSKIQSKFAIDQPSNNKVINLVAKQYKTKFLNLSSIIKANKAKQSNKKISQKVLNQTCNSELNNFSKSTSNNEFNQHFEGRQSQSKFRSKSKGNAEFKNIFINIIGNISNDSKRISKSQVKMLNTNTSTKKTTSSQQDICQGIPHCNSSTKDELDTSNKNSNCNNHLVIENLSIHDWHPKKNATESKLKENHFLDSLGIILNSTHSNGLNIHELSPEEAHFLQIYIRRNNQKMIENLENDLNND